MAIGTDFNPGSSPTLSLPAVASVAVLMMRRSPAQALHAITINAAWALRRHERLGSLEVGKQMDCVLLDAPDHRLLFYHWAVNLVDTVVKAGRVVVEDGRPRSPSARCTALEEVDELLDAEEEGDLEEEE